MVSIDAALGTLAQLGVAIPGFTAVIAALTHRHRQFSPPERISFFLMLILASVVVVGSLLPFVLIPIVGETETWRWCCLLLGVALFSFAVGTGALAWRKRGTPQAARKPTLLWLTGIIPFCLVGLGEIAGYAQPHPSLYLGGLVTSILGAGYLFWFTALISQRADGAESSGLPVNAVLPEV